MFSGAGLQLGGSGSAASSSGGDAALNTYNLQDNSLLHLRAAMASLRLGTADVNLVCLGDSITNNAGASSNAKGYPAQFAAFLAQRTGLAVRQGVVFPQQNSVNDARFTLGSGWSRAGMPGLLSGILGASAAAGAAGTLDFLDTSSVDGFEILYLSAGGAGGFTWAIDGGSTTTQAPPGGALAVQRLAVSAGAAGSHTLNIGALGSGNQVYIVGVKAILSTTRAIRWTGMGQNGVTAQSVAGTGLASSSDTLATFAVSAQADLAVDALGINDWFLAASASDATLMQTALLTTLSSLKGISRPASVLYLGEGQASTDASNTNSVSRTPFYALLDGIAVTAGVPALRIDRRWGSYTAVTTSPVAFNSGDGIHPSDQGHADMASALATLVGNCA